MPGFTPVVIGPNSDGEPYCISALLPAVEGDLWGFFSNPNIQWPVPVLFNQAVLADVVFTAQGNPAPGTAYVVLQTNLGDNNWLDVAWCQTTITSGSVVFGLSGGAYTCTSFQQRATGATPTGNGSNQIPLGGTIRFVGKTVASGSSSSSGSSGSPSGILVSIRFKQLGLR